MSLESEVFGFLVIGLLLGHLVFALGGGYIIYKKHRNHLGPFWGYILCSLISFYLLLNAIFGERMGTSKYFFPIDSSICMAFFGVFWLLGIFMLIALIAMLCKGRRATINSK